MNYYNFTKRKYLRIFDPGYNYSTKRFSGKTLAVIMLVFLYMFLCVWLSSQSIKYNYKYNELIKEADKIRIKNRALEIKLQSMMSSEQIAKIAKERYGFKNPSDDQIVVIKKEKSVFKFITAMIKGENL
ncbi:MAG: cell division protein FtsL [Candidatus Goldbacteria bacterium]|nr:cell division protein FtsL [Candidatus Goldiibacteriota bacterium]